MKLLSKSFFLVVLLSLNLFFCPIIRAAEDEVEEDEEAVVSEDNLNEETQTVAETEADEETDSALALSSPFVKTNVLFIQPESSDLPAGRLVKLLIGFQNNGTSNFVVDSIDGSFRYPQDFSYYIQNFSVFDFNKVIESEKESTFDYYFTPSETFSSRQFGLTINLRYRDMDGKSFVNTVFNETINVVEPEEGLDGETFFLYVFLAAILVLLGFGAYQYLSVFKKKSRSSKSAYSSNSAQKISNGNSSNADDIDYEWIPQEHLQTNKSPKVSPRQRGVKTRKNGNALSSSGNSSNDEQ